MGPRLKFSLWLAALFGAVAAVVAAVGTLFFAGLAPRDRQVFARALEEEGPLLAFIALIVFIACAGLLRWLFARFVLPLRALAEQTVLVASANVEHRVVAQGGPETAELARAINRLGDAYRVQHGDMDARVAESNARLEEERNRLAALMSELSEGVLVCNEQGRILLYNEQARRLFAPATEGPLAPQSPVGLGRPIFAFLDRHQVAHAMEKLQDGLTRGTWTPVTMFFSGATDDLIRVRFAPTLSTEGRMAGLVLTCDDVTKALGQESSRRSLLQALATRVRQPAANVRAAAENLTAFPDMGDADRARFAGIIAVESRNLSETVDAALREYADALQSGVSLEDMRLADLLNVARRRIDAQPGLAARAEPIDDSLWVKVDSYAFAQVLAALAARLGEELAVREVAFRAAAHGGFAELDLAWSGAAPAPGVLDRWEALPIRVGTEQTPLTLRQVLERHGGEVWQQPGPGAGDMSLRFLVPLAEPRVPAEPQRPPTSGSRPEYYDFDLFHVADSARGLLGQRLADLSYTVFDTETTGVEPSAGDKIISIGAVRIVNGRLLRQEIYQQLVDPKRSVPRDSIRIHGIKPENLAGQPTLREVLPAFHRFCEDTVLVGHNAAFDMRFLELAEAETGVRFTQPVLDTLLLSAVVHRNQPDHGLEAIAQRLGVAVVGRHTAIGDAMVTSEIFLKLLQLLAEQGVETLGQALEASRETYYVRLQY
jgi:DNA polymerase-3 subunit epsilon